MYHFCWVRVSRRGCFWRGRAWAARPACHRFDSWPSSRDRSACPHCQTKFRSSDSSACHESWTWTLWSRCWRAISAAVRSRPCPRRCSTWAWAALRRTLAECWAVAVAAAAAWAVVGRRAWVRAWPPAPAHSACSWCSSWSPLSSRCIGLVGSRRRRWHSLRPLSWRCLPTCWARARSQSRPPLPWPPEQAQEPQQAELAWLPQSWPVVDLFKMRSLIIFVHIFTILNLYPSMIKKQAVNGFAVCVSLAYHTANRF